MIHTKQHLTVEVVRNLVANEQEIKASDEELQILNAKLKVEKKTRDMEDMPENLTHEFSYSIQALENMIVVEQNRNLELKTDQEVMQYRKKVIESQFTDSELDG